MIPSDRSLGPAMPLKQPRVSIAQPHSRNRADAVEAIKVTARAPAPAMSSGASDPGRDHAVARRVAFFAPIVAGAEWLRLKQEVRWLNGPLGAARDSDVMVEYARSQKYRAWAQTMIGARIAQCQTRDHRRLVRCLRSARTQRLIAALARWARQGAWLELYTRRKDAETLPSYCARVLNRWHARLLRKGKRLKTVGAGRRHRLRIRVKPFATLLRH